MISVTNLRTGVCFAEHGDPWRVLIYKHTHMSRGSGTIKVKCKNLRTGNVLTKTFRSGEQVEEIFVSKREMQYLYREEDEHMFMDPTSFEQLAVEDKVIGGDGAYLKEGEIVGLVFWDEEPLFVNLPPKMIFKIKDAAPGERGDSASNVYKDATLENGLKVRVPLFINVGDKVRVDTRDGSYVERVSG